MTTTRRVAIKKPAKEWAYDEMRDDYLAGEGSWFEVSEAFYWQALEVLPPIYLPHGFFVGEPERDTRDGTLYAAFTRCSRTEIDGGERFFARYSTRKTWLRDYQELRRAINLTPLDGATVHKIETLEAKHG